MTDVERLVGHRGFTRSRKTETIAKPTCKNPKKPSVPTEYMAGPCCDYFGTVEGNTASDCRPRAFGGPGRRAALLAGSVGTRNRPRQVAAGGKLSFVTDEADSRRTPASPPGKLGKMPTPCRVGRKCPPNTPKREVDKPFAAMALGEPIRLITLE